MIGETLNRLEQSSIVMGLNLHWGGDSIKESRQYENLYRTWVEIGQWRLY